MQVVSMAKTTCTMSAKPSQLVVIPTRQRTAGGQPAAHQPAGRREQQEQRGQVADETRHGDQHLLRIAIFI